MRLLNIISATLACALTLAEARACIGHSYVFSRTYSATCENGYKLDYVKCSPACKLNKQGRKFSAEAINGRSTTVGWRCC
ncbi:hypothetical protein BCR32DRAFT_326262 [Anaeromyces robustus]|uniref:Uncharacterized protein n=1 Tax=Anaeromyces robustus TaxID=1754192 RepID=A0A1Y1XDA8_9FUNG|nr:hypothetical protein BCR32DRAFT_326262 [Anaeromyces robustus]|eukprot:ORX83713.1 hypothetical protein BCR32DRAFT_326262 [Anaeromyces robustus]